MPTQAARPGRLIVVRMNSGEDVLRALRAAVTEHAIRHASILSGAGSLSRYHVHVVETTNLPPGDVFFRGEGPSDILAITGLVMDGRVHAHITFSNTEKAMGGHLEEGCTVLTFAIAVIAEALDCDLTGWDRMGQV